MEKEELIVLLNKEGYHCENVNQVPTVILPEQTGWKKTLVKIAEVIQINGYKGSYGIKTGKM